MRIEREAEAGRFTAAAREADPDRFLCVLPAPASMRDALCVLILVNNELVRATEQPSARSGAGPIAALIRLQWWREVIANGRDDWHGQPVAVALRALLDGGRVRQDTLLHMVAARETEADGPLDDGQWRQTLLDGAGGLQRAIGEALGVDAADADRLAATGAAFACGALRRYLPALAASDRSVLPAGLQQLGLERQRAFLAVEGEAFLRRAGGDTLPRGQACALLPLVLARRDLRRDASAFDRAGGARGIGDRLAVIAAGIRG